jgi:hypothetical protein
MSALVQPISDAESLALLRRRMIREVEVFLEGSIARAGNAVGWRMIPTQTAPPRRPVAGWASWYHSRLDRSSAASVGEAGSC